MSVLTVTPEVVSVAAGDLSGIGSTISEANVVAAAPTLGVVAPAADSVSAELAALFGGHAETYQAVSAQGQVFHQEFVNALSTSSAAYARAEADSASGLGKGHAAEGLRVLGSRQHQIAAGDGSRLWQPTRPALWKPGMSDPRLITPRHSLPAGSRLWHPAVPGFKTHGISAPRLFTPHNELLGGVLNGSRGIVQNVGGLIEQIIQNQISYLKLIGTSLVNFVKDELKAIIGLPEAFMQSIKDLLHGNISGAMNDIIKGFGHFFVTGIEDTGTVIYLDGHDGTWRVYRFSGPMGDLWQMMKIPQREAQNLADMLKPLGFGILGNLVQRVAADPLTALANAWHMYVRTGGTSLSMGTLQMGPGIALTFDLLGAPILSMRAIEDSLQAVLNNLLAGHLLRAGVDLLAAPVNVAHAFLFGQGYLQLPTLSPGAGQGKWYEEQVHLGGVFAPLGHSLHYSGTYPYWTEAIDDTMTGGLVPALVSTLPSWLQNPLDNLGASLEEIVAKLHALLNPHPSHQL